MCSVVASIRPILYYSNEGTWQAYYRITAIYYSNEFISEIIKISRDTWLPIGTFSDPDSLGAVTAMALSVNGAYLASACSSNITIWSTQDRRVISRYVTC